MKPSKARSGGEFSDGRSCSLQGGGGTRPSLLPRGQPLALRGLPHPKSFTLGADDAAGMLGSPACRAPALGWVCKHGSARSVANCRATKLTESHVHGQRRASGHRITEPQDHKGRTAAVLTRARAPIDLQPQRGEQTLQSKEERRWVLLGVWKGQ